MGPLLDMADCASTIVAASVLFRVFTCFIDDIYLKRKIFSFFVQTDFAFSEGKKLILKSLFSLVLLYVLLFLP